MDVPFREVNNSYFHIVLISYIFHLLIVFNFSFSYRFLGKLKKTIKNYAHVEGSIREAYLCQETSHFCSYYFEPHVLSKRNRVGRNDDGGEDETMQPSLSIFNKPGRPFGKCKTRPLLDKEMKAAHLHVLLNCDEVQPFIE